MTQPDEYRMADSSFEDRLSRIRENSEPREITPALDPSPPRERTEQDDRDDGHGALLEIFLGILASGMGGLFFFDRALALQVALIGVPVMLVLGLIILRRAMRNGAGDLLDAGWDMFDIAKSIGRWFN